jgi:integrase
MYFLFKTGVRNAEAVGLRVSAIDLKENLIHIREVLARSLQSASSTSRTRKGTKNGKDRVIPLTKDLHALLLPLLEGKSPDALVFTSPTGVAIDDHNFQNRVFKKVLKGLNIPERVLYAARHTFGSRCIDQGLTPVMTAFLMGNNPETALRRYTHQMSLPTELPDV